MGERCTGITVLIGLVQPGDYMPNVAINIVLWSAI
jgi:hypothetical protein